MKRPTFPRIPKLENCRHQECEIKPAPGQGSMNIYSYEHLLKFIQIYTFIPIFKEKSNCVV